MILKDLNYTDSQISEMPDDILKNAALLDGVFSIMEGMPDSDERKGILLEGYNKGVESLKNMLGITSSPKIEHKESLPVPEGDIGTPAQQPSKQDVKDAIAAIKLQMKFTEDKQMKSDMKDTVNALTLYLKTL